jgi:hypothetical protein
LNYRIDNGEQYNILDDSDIDDIQSDPTFQQFAKIICSDLDNNGFQVCRQGLSTTPAATGTPEGGAGQITSPSLDGTDQSLKIVIMIMKMKMIMIMITMMMIMMTDRYNQTHNTSVSHKKLIRQ